MESLGALLRAALHAPLVAKRLLALSALSEELGEEPLVRFDLPQPESYWDEFAVDVAINSAPVLLLLAALASARPRPPAPWAACCCWSLRR
ncbi:MAG: hypothetical protein IPG96_21525 [Proteobacteria bacterium]|nr:hypothetical protein [Pseudomonadota bacterium]